MVERQVVALEGAGSIPVIRLFSYRGGLEATTLTLARTPTRGDPVPRPEARVSTAGPSELGSSERLQARDTYPFCGGYAGE